MSIFHPFCMGNFEQETVLIWFHVSLSLTGHPHEPIQPQPHGPQQEIDIKANIVPWGNFGRESVLL